MLCSRTKQVDQIFLFCFKTFKVYFFYKKRVFFISFFGLFLLVRNIQISTEMMSLEDKKYNTFDVQKSYFCPLTLFCRGEKDTRGALGAKIICKWGTRRTTARDRDTNAKDKNKKQLFLSLFLWLSAEEREKEEIAAAKENSCKSPKRLISFPWSSDSEEYCILRVYIKNKLGIFLYEEGWARIFLSGRRRRRHFITIKAWREGKAGGENASRRRQKRVERAERKRRGRSQKWVPRIGPPRVLFSTLYMNTHKRECVHVCL